MYDCEVTIWAPLREVGETMHRRIGPLYTFDKPGAAIPLVDDPFKLERRLRLDN